MTEDVEVRRWRTGRKVGRTIYDHAAGEADGTLIGLMDTPELATRVVDAVNFLLEVMEAPLSEGERQANEEVNVVYDKLVRFDELTLVARRALEALEYCRSEFDVHPSCAPEAIEWRVGGAIAALEAALKVEG